MKITKLHLILLLLIISGILAARTILENIEISNRQRELEILRLQEVERKLLAEIERKKQEEQTEEKRIRANQSIAVAGEYWKTARREGRDISTGQAILRSAKENFAAGDYDRAWELAHKAVRGLKSAGAADRRHTVVRGDNLWRISSMKKHFGKGHMWHYIWAANKKKIKNPRLIYPKQKFLIPTESWQKYREEVATLKKTDESTPKKIKPAVQPEPL